jgi:hypothetical protein
VAVIDCTLEDDLLEEVVEAIKALLQTIPSSTHIGLLSLDSCVTLYDLSPPHLPGGGQPNTEGASPIPAWVLPGNTLATPEMLKRLEEASTGFIAPVATCMHAACAALDALRPLHTSVPPRSRPRCIGAAIAAALLLYLRFIERQAVPLPSASGGRLLTLLGGPGTYGPGSVPIDVIDGLFASSEDQFTLKEAEKFADRLASDLREAGAWKLRKLISLPVPCLSEHFNMLSRC